MVVFERSDAEYMGRAIENANRARLLAPPNPWVGAVLVNGPSSFDGWTQRPGEAHAEVVAIQAAGDAAAGATLYSTLEPCNHQGRTPPCVDAIAEAGIARVVVALEDPDENVAGAGIARLRDLGVDVVVGVGAAQVRRQLAVYLHHRRTGRPWVVLKLAATIDGRTAAPDGSSQWITGPEARADGHSLRAESDAILVGAGTVRIDDPALTVRDFDPPDGVNLDDVQPMRVVLGRAPESARAQPMVELSGDLGEVLDELGRRGVMQLLVEGGAMVTGAFHQAGLIDAYVLYLAPALFGGDDALAMFRGAGAPSIDHLWRGRIAGVQQVGDDLRVELRGRSQR